MIFQPPTKKDVIKRQKKRNKQMWLNENIKEVKSFKDIEYVFNKNRSDDELLKKW